MSEKRNLNCYIIKDLLPLYCDHLLSDESKADLELHLANCADCRSSYEQMSEGDEEMQSDQLAAIEPLKKVRWRNRLKITGAVIATLIVVTIAFFYLFVGITPVKSDEMDVTYRGENVTIEGEDENGTTVGVNGYRLEFKFVLQEGKVMNTRGEKNSDDKELSFYSVYRLPMDDRGKYPNEFTYGIEQSEPFDDHDRLVVHYRDKEVTYNLKELAEECGIQ